MRIIAITLLFATLCPGCDEGGIGLGGDAADAPDESPDVEAPDVESPDVEPPFVEAQYTVEYLSGSRVRTRVGELSDSLSGGDFYGYCTALWAGDDATINIQVADPASWPSVVWMVKFHRLEWTEGATASVACDHIEIFDETVGSDFIPCGGGGDGTCQVTVSRNEDLDAAVQVWFSCPAFDTNVSTGGVPNTMSISSGAMQIQHCAGF
jgi:hypothetical protein